MNLPDAEYCSFCGKAIGALTLERIRQRKRDFVITGMEMDLGILDDCFHIVFEKMVQDEYFMKWNPATSDRARAHDAGGGQTNEQKPRKRGSKPRNG
jgi:hypothetical protein